MKMNIILMMMFHQLDDDVFRQQNGSDEVKATLKLDSQLRNDVHK